METLSLAITSDGPATTIVALLIGLVAVLAAVSWRVARHLRLRRGLLAGLRDTDPAVRHAAVAQAAELGFASTAPALLRAVRTESDPTVLAAVVRAVASRQWEPASSAGIVELRLWARAYAERHPEVRRTGGGAPMLSGVAGAVPPPSLDPERQNEFRTRQDHVPHHHGDGVDAPASAAAVSPLEDDPDRMGPVRVVVTGAGGAAGVAVIRALRSRGHHVIAVDADPTAAGLHLAQDSRVIPRGDEPHYLAALLRVATVCDAQALVCTVAEEYRALAGAQDYFAEAGIRTLMPTLESVEVCLDKWRFHQSMNDDGLPVPATALGSVNGVPGPWIVKPRNGRGSRDVVAAESRTQVNAAVKTVPQPLVQTRLTGREFTCDTLVDASGATLSTVARWRTETRGGISTKGTTFDDPEVCNVVTLALKAVGLVGPANVQGFVADDGTVTLLEINPRFSGGLPLSVAAGADLVEEYLRGVMGLAMRPERLVARPGVTMTRYFSEAFS